MCSTHFKSSVRAMCFLPRLRRLWGLAQCMEWGESQLLLRESWERLSTAAWPKWHETDASDAGCHEDMKLWWSVHGDRLWLRQSLCILMWEDGNPSEWQSLLSRGQSIQNITNLSPLACAWHGRVVPRRHKVKKCIETSDVVEYLEYLECT